MPRRPACLFAALGALSLAKLLDVTTPILDHRFASVGFSPVTMDLKDAAKLVEFSAGFGARNPKAPPDPIDPVLAPFKIEKKIPDERDRRNVLMWYVLKNNSMNMYLKIRYNWGDPFKSLILSVRRDGVELLPPQSPFGGTVSGGIMTLGPGETLRDWVLLSSDFDFTVEGDYTIDAALPLEATVRHIDHESWTVRERISRHITHP